MTCKTSRTLLQGLRFRPKYWENQVEQEMDHEMEAGMCGDMGGGPTG